MTNAINFWLLIGLSCYRQSIEQPFLLANSNDWTKNMPMILLYYNIQKQKIQKKIPRIFFRMMVSIERSIKKVFHLNQPEFPIWIWQNAMISLRSCEFRAEKRSNFKLTGNETKIKKSQSLSQSLKTTSTVKNFQKYWTLSSNSVTFSLTWDIGIEHMYFH